MLGSRVCRSLGLLLMLGAAPVLAFDVDTCGQNVPAGAIGILQVDLTGCVTNTVVSLGEGAVLQMNGHSIAGTGSAVRCLGRRCSVIGPGDIGGGVDGIEHPPSKGVLVVQSINIHDTTSTGITAPSTVRITDVSVTGNGFGALNPEYTFAILAGKVQVTNVTTNNNAGIGVYSNSLTATALTSTGNGHAGVLIVQRSPRSIQSTITGNNGFDAGIDVVTQRRPRLVETTCGLSAQVPPAGTTVPGPAWGVCANDP